MARNGNAKTKHVVMNMLKASVAITGAALLFACGDDSSSGADGSQTATGVDSTVESVDDLINCTPKHEGETAYIKEEKATYVCVDGDWITASISESVDDLLNCTPKHEGETVFVKEDKKIYVCTDGDWVVTGETLDEGDDDGDNADKKSSSSRAKSADSKGKSSSSDKEVSSSSVTLSEVEGSSSSSVISGSDPESSSSDSNDDGKSSSSSKAKSSSSEGGGGASSSSVIPGSDPESSSSDGNDDGKSSSSSTAKSSSSVESSSSVIPGSDPESSSSDGNDDGKSSSSSTAKSSSSEGGGGASSSSVIASSSSEELVSSSSFNKSSSSSRGLFEMSKDEFLNPKITYGTMTDTRDNQVYKTVEICNNETSTCQTWMAENLNYDYNKGTAKSFCYDGIEANCEVTGRLYTWAAAIDSVALANDADNSQTCGYGKTCTLPTVVQGVCPEGWHLPSYDEWETLFTAVGGSSKAGTALKSQTGWKSQTGDAADRDAYGFSALPAGRRNGGGNFINAGDYANFWSASQYEGNSYSAYYVFLYYYDEKARRDYLNKGHGFSVRCLQN